MATLIVVFIGMVVIGGTLALLCWINPGPCRRCNMPDSWHPHTTGHAFEREHWL